MAQIIPGVQVTVVKEVAPPQLAPSGVLGLIGLTENELKKTERASSWSRFLEVCGAASAYSMPEARMALANGVFELVIVPMTSLCAISASVEIDALTHSYEDALSLCDKNEALNEPLKKKLIEAKTKLDDAKDALKNAASNELNQLIGVAGKLKIEGRAKGSWSNGFTIIVTQRIKDSEKFDLEIKNSEGVSIEVHRNLMMSIDKDNNDETLKSNPIIVNVINKNSAVVEVTWNAKTNLESKNDNSKEIIQTKEYRLSGGKDASAQEYINALEKLKDEPDVDMVLASIQDFPDKNAQGDALVDPPTYSNVTQIYSNIISHCQLMSANSKGRIGIGHVAPGCKQDAAVTMANTLFSDRFVLLAPHGVAGAVAGRIGGLDYYQSPTFKNLTGLSNLSALPSEEQSRLLNAHVVPIVNQQGRGVIILRGLTTDGDQISVRRVADRAVRGTRMIGELFIGRLNNEDGRGALKQKLIEFLAQMEKEGALVPSTDGKDSAFKVDVYSSQTDFAQGIVRVDIAVRPVRAIDFIYATIFVQV
jgi:hypothetical protein